MKVTILVEQEYSEDGLTGEVYLSRSVYDTFELMSLISDSARAMGFTYWDRTGFATSNGEESWEKF